jgi:hypothetical protein
LLDCCVARSLAKSAHRNVNRGGASAYRGDTVRCRKTQIVVGMYADFELRRGTPQTRYYVMNRKWIPEADGVGDAESLRSVVFG